MFDLQGTPLKKNFVLPDFHQILRGYVKPDFEPFSNTEQNFCFILPMLVSCSQEYNMQRCRRYHLLKILLQK
eukprot:gene7023-5059_t